MKTPSARTPRPRKSTTTAKSTPKSESRTSVRPRRASRQAPAESAEPDVTVVETSVVTTRPVIEEGSDVPAVEVVRVRAYEIYLSRNGEGDALSDWLQAERELLGR